MSAELETYRALVLVESNLKIGYRPRHALQKAVELLDVDAGELAVLLLEKALQCAQAREQRLSMEMIDKLVDASPTMRGTSSGHRTGRRRAA
jgi:hypothetical protein